MARTRPRIVAILPGFSASTLMDVVIPLLSLETSGAIHFSAWLDFYRPPAFLKQADLLVFCRNAEPANRKYLDYARANQIPYIYDLDDNLFEVPPGTDLGRYYQAPERVALLEQYLSLASLVRTYSAPLLQRVQGLNAHVEQVTPPLHWSLLDRRPTAKKAGPVKIIYVTSRSDDWLAEIFLPALRYIQEQYPGRVEIYFWGYCPPEMAGREGVRVIKPEPNYRVFMKKFSAAGFDIGLAPLKDDLFHRSKTNNKYREYAACGIAGIYSDVDVYARCVEAGHTGLLVENTQVAWQAALVRLIEDDDLRESISANAYADVCKNYPEGEFSKTWEQQINQVLNQQYNRPAVSSAGAQTGSPLPAALPVPKRSVAARFLKRGHLLAQILKAELYNVWMLVKINGLKRI